jgi:hypothetical protein
MIDWLNDNSGAVQALAVIILVIVTAVSVWLTVGIASATKSQAAASAKAVDEMREQRMYESQPLLDIKRHHPSGDSESSNEFEWQNHVWCSIRNVGRGPALNISAKLLYEVDEWSGQQSLGALGPGMETGPVPLEVAGDEVLVEYSDNFLNRYIARRIVEFDGNVGPLLQTLKIERLP